jgi:hypothetical protein
MGWRGTRGAAALAMGAVLLLGGCAGAMMDGDKGMMMKKDDGMMKKEGGMMKEDKGMMEKKQ